MITVYLVDDSSLVRERLVGMLADLDDTEVVGHTGNPWEALLAIRRLQPDVVILDIELPGRNGLELLRDIKRDRARTRVIVLSNYTYPQYRKECLEAGAEYFLSKAKEFEAINSILGGLEGSSASDRGSLEGEGKPYDQQPNRPP